ncbi:MAG: bifunctional folylpolyglutamate synthase/dihydrofolate synthase, partial [Dehalococcoidia bacterium]|nr:bifunctional folylpolyglutamate synthase/dihydrofolate synthase [Dehalococcoidia bacterium]
MQTSTGVATNSNYRRALRRLLGLVDHERIASVRSGSHPGRIRYHLGRMQRLLEELGNPHIGIPTVHIAGTKGKGSTSAMCASILTRSGYRVGLFTSPHMHSFRERIQIGGEPVS